MSSWSQQPYHITYRPMGYRKESVRTKVTFPGIYHKRVQCSQAILMFTMCRFQCQGTGCTASAQLPRGRRDADIAQNSCRYRNQQNYPFSIYRKARYFAVYLPILLCQQFLLWAAYANSENPFQSKGSFASVTGILWEELCVSVFTGWSTGMFLAVPYTWSLKP